MSEPSPPPEPPQWADESLKELVNNLEASVWKPSVNIGALYGQLQNLDKRSSKVFLNLLLVKNIWLFDRLFSFVSYCEQTHPNQRNTYRHVRNRKELDQLCVCWSNPYSLLDAQSILKFVDFFQPALATGDNIETTIINAIVNSGLEYIYLDGNTWGEVESNWPSRPVSLKGLPDDTPSIIGFGSIYRSSQGLLIRAPSSLTIHHPNETTSEVHLPWMIKRADGRGDATKIIMALCRRYVTLNYLLYSYCFLTNKHPLSLFTLQVLRDDKITCALSASAARLPQEQSRMHLPPHNCSCGVECCGAGRGLGGGGGAGQAHRPASF